MARVIAGGVLSSGLVSIPVDIHAAIEDQSIHMHWLHKKYGSRVRDQFFAPSAKLSGTRGFGARLAEEGTMISRRTLLPVAFVALTSVLGCQTVPSSVTVDIPTAETPQDEALSKSVLDRLLADKKADLTGIKVVSNNGKVYLSGTVKSLDARQQAIKIAWEVPGVQTVVNGLEVQK